MKAFILAGGFATRLWPLTEKRAKPLLPLAGKSLLTHLVEKMPEGVPITVSTNQAFSEDFNAWKSQTPNPKPQIDILIEDAGHEDEKLGALGAVRKWITEGKIDDDVLLLAGDNYLGFPLERFLQAYAGKPLLAVHDIHEKERAKHMGVVTMDGTRVMSFEEKPREPRSTLVSTGCCVLPQDTLSPFCTFAREHPDNIGGIFEYFLQEGIAVEGATFSEPWFDIGSFEAYLAATKALVGEKRLLGEHATCNASTCNGSVVLGKGSHVAKSKFRNVVLFEDCEVTDCVLENCIVDNRCVLQGVDLTGKMLREGTHLVRV